MFSRLSFINNFLFRAIVIMLSVIVLAGCAGNNDKLVSVNHTDVETSEILTAYTPHREVREIDITDKCRFSYQRSDCLSFKRFRKSQFLPTACIEV